MSIFLGILLTFFVFLVVVLIHELGHFSTARMTGMKVLEFGFGIPPKVFRLFRDKKGTDYTFNALPIGGFVRIKGEDPTSLESLDADSFSSKAWWARALVLVAGVTMNFLLAFSIIFSFFLLGTAPIAPNFLLEKDYNSLLLPSVKDSFDSGYITADGVEVTPLTGSIAERAGIRPGDIVRALGGAPIQKSSELIEEIHKNQPLTLTLAGTGGEREVVLTPENGKVGMYIGYKNPHVNEGYILHFGFLDACTHALHETYVLSYMTLDIIVSTLKNLILPSTPKDRSDAEAMLSGPIGMGAGFVDMVDHGVTWHMILMIIAMLSINLGVINILPFPALDGGRLVSTTIASLIGRYVRDRNRMGQIETYIHAIGMVLLLGLSLFIAFLDMTKLF